MDSTLRVHERKKKRKSCNSQMRFRVRVDELNPETESGLLRFITKWCSKRYVLVKHVVNNNPHFHFFLDNDTYMSCQSLRYQLDKDVGCKAHQRSVKECDPSREDEYIQYLFNEKHGNIWRMVLSNIDTTEHQSKAKQIAEDFTKSVSAKRTKSQILTTWDMAEEVRKLFLADNTEPTSEYEIYRIHIDYAIDVCRKHRKTYTDFSIQRIVQTALTADRRNRDQFTRNVMDRIFRN